MSYDLAEMSRSKASGVPRDLYEIIDLVAETVLLIVFVTLMIAPIIDLVL